MNIKGLSAGLILGAAIIMCVPEGHAQPTGGRGGPRGGFALVQLKVESNAFQDGGIVPASAAGIPEGSLPAGSVVGTSTMRTNAYFGPGAPPGDRYHHYVFEFYALSEDLDLPTTSGRAELLEAMQGKVVAKATYVGRYQGDE